MLKQHVARLRYAISQEDVESANLALEDATGMGASAEDSSDLSIFLGEKHLPVTDQELKQAEEKISALRLKLDPEAHGFSVGTLMVAGRYQMAPP